MKVITSRKVLSACALTLFASAAFAAPWKFGVMSDTQWPTSPDNKNPNVAVNVVRHINDEMVSKGVKFVIQVGDLTDGGSNTQLDTRATFAQSLYNAGIGFYPLRGNHESTQAGAVKCQLIFPQTQTGNNNLTPSMVSSTIYGDLTNTSLYPDYTTNTFTVGSNFVSELTLEGLTYSFDYDNARFVMIDQFTKPNNTAHANLDATDVAWIGGRFSDPNRPAHAFSFAHKHLISENHNDNLFNSTNPTASTASKDLMESFMQKLQDNGVRYHIGGHDHMHNRAMISSPNTGSYHVQNIVTSSNSYKFYIPPTATILSGQTWRSLETPLAQELFTVGYYIFTVDGPRVTADFYSMPNGCNGDCDETYDNIPYAGNTPTYNGLYTATVPFTKHETFGYSLNGKEVIVPQGGSYVLSDDTTKAGQNESGYLGTTAKILSGSNGSTAKDFSQRKLNKSINTGWAPKTEGLASDIFTLWGMQNSLATDFTDTTNSNLNYKYVVPNQTKTDTYALSVSYDSNIVVNTDTINAGHAVTLNMKDASGNWVNAVDQNVGGRKRFILGKYNSSYPLGTYGVDPVTHTAWAVINATGGPAEFAVVSK